METPHGNAAAQGFDVRRDDERVALFNDLKGSAGGLPDSKMKGCSLPSPAPGLDDRKSSR